MELYQPKQIDYRIAYLNTIQFITLKRRLHFFFFFNYLIYKWLGLRVYFQKANTRESLPSPALATRRLVSGQLTGVVCCQRKNKNRLLWWSHEIAPPPAPFSPPQPHTCILFSAPCRGGVWRSACWLLMSALTSRQGAAASRLTPRERNLGEGSKVAKEAKRGEVEEDVNLRENHPASHFLSRLHIHTFPSKSLGTARCNSFVLVDVWLFRS